MSPAGHRARESAPDARRTRLCEHAAVGKPYTYFSSFTRRGTFANASQFFTRARAAGSGSRIRRESVANPSQTF
eukprot:3768869-Prymnesium_polylepis.1